MNKTLIIVVVLVLILGGAYMFIGMDSKVEAPAVENLNEVSESLPGTSGTEVATPETKVFIVEGANFSFVPNTMNVKKGDRVQITFKNQEGFHDLKIDEFGVATAQIKAGEEQTVEFVADKTGTFEYYCSVGEHRKMGMVGTLTVSE